MKAHFYSIALLSLFAWNAGFSQDAQETCNELHDFEPREQVFIYGNNVKLRSAPRMESNVLKLLKIGEWVEIIEKTPYSWPYQGFDSSFYKVKYDTEEGYILGGLLAFKKKTIAGQDYFFALSKEGKQPHLNIRQIVRRGYEEQKIQLSHTHFDMRLLGNKGIYQLDDILYIDYYGGTCGTEGGGIYLFAQNGTLSVIGELSQIFDSNAFYASEVFVFPNDTGGIPDTLLFKKETVSFLDKASDWKQTHIETRKFCWSEGKLVPEFREKGNK